MCETVKRMPLQRAKERKSRQMRKMSNRLLGLATALILVFGILPLTAFAAEHTAVVATAQQLRDALGDPQIKVINLTDSFVVQEGAAGTNAGIFELDRAGVLLNGNGHTITVAGQGARAGHLLNVTADRVQINDLIVDGGGLVKHGINVWNAAGVTLGDVVSRNNLGTGLTVSGAEVAVMGRLSTSGNRWGGVNVGSGTGTSVAPKLTFLPGAGYSTQNEINGIYVDAAEAEKTGHYIF